MENPTEFTYHELVRRNQGYVSPVLQERIHQTRLLIAGCGVGSSIAEAAVRLGFDKLILADGDAVELHNLNRQAYVASDVGRKKVHALADRLLAIHPHASIQTYDGWVHPSNAALLVSNADLVLDTIDFLSLEGIVALHDECRRQEKPLISGISVGWGAMAIYFPPDGCTFREVFGLPTAGGVQDASYTKHFGKVLERVADRLNPEVVEALSKVFPAMEDNIPCPAPHVSAGASNLASLVLTMAIRLLRGDPVTPAPHAITTDLMRSCSTAGINLLEPATSQNGHARGVENPRPRAEEGSC